MMLFVLSSLCQNWDELALRLQAKGVDVTFKTKGSTSQVEGIRFTKMA